MNRRVLIVEDHDSLRTLMGTFLSRNFDVIGAKNGLEAMAVLSRGEIPDVIVTDAVMPGLDGEAFLSNLRCSGLYAHIPVLVVSGVASDESEAHYKSLGARDFIRKPFNPLSLQNRLMELAG